MKENGIVINKSSLAPFDDVKTLTARIENEILKIREVQEAISELQTEYEKAGSLKIISEKDYAAAGASLTVISNNIKRLRDGIKVTPSGNRMKELKSALHALHKGVKAIEDDLISKGIKAEIILKEKSRAYLNEQQRKQDLLEAEALAKAEKKRAELFKKAEVAKRDQTRERLIEEARQTVAATPDVMPNKTDGIKKVKVWNADITDKRTLILWLLDNRLTGFVTIKESDISQHAKDNNLEIIPGVKITTSWDVYRK